MSGQHDTVRGGCDISHEVVRGLPVSNRTFAATVDKLVEWACSRDQMRYFACVNAHSAETAHRDREFMASLRNANLLVPDGFAVVIASRILGGDIRERATGPDLFLAVSHALNELGGKSVYYLGGSEATLRKIVDQHRIRFPRLGIAGTYSPPFRAKFSEAELRSMAERVSDAHADVLWIGLGAPKQEKWIWENRERVKVSLCGPVGAMFDYFSGNVPMPPKWVERCGLHWAHRLVRNPRRLWRRNLDSPLFLARVVADRLAGAGQTTASDSTRIRGS